MGRKVEMFNLKSMQVLWNVSPKGIFQRRKFRVSYKSPSRIKSASKG